MSDKTHDQSIISASVRKQIDGMDAADSVTLDVGEVKRLLDIHDAAITQRNDLISKLNVLSSNKRGTDTQNLRYYQAARAYDKGIKRMRRKFLAQKKRAEDAENLAESMSNTITLQKKQIAGLKRQVAEDRALRTALSDGDRVRFVKDDVKYVPKREAAKS